MECRFENEVVAGWSPGLRVTGGGEIGTRASLPAQPRVGNAASFGTERICCYIVMQTQWLGGCAT